MIKNVFIFLLGATAGSLITWKLVEQKYKKIANDEIEEMAEHFSNIKKEITKKEQEIIEDDSVIATQTIPASKINETYIHEDTDGYISMLKETGYLNEGHKDYIQPYVIAPEEFGEIDDYEMNEWVYYSDYTLVDEMNTVISNPEKYIGKGLEHFGEYEDDAVYIRNENLKSDYEILRSEKTFSEALGEVI